MNPKRVNSGTQGRANTEAPNNRQEIYLTVTFVIAGFRSMHRVSCWNGNLGIQFYAYIVRSERYGNSTGNYKSPRDFYKQPWNGFRAAAHF